MVEKIFLNLTYFVGSIKYTGKNEVEKKLKNIFQNIEKINSK